MKKTALLARSECSALRGLAIMAIILHNYCHWIGFAVKENEFMFNIGNSRRLWQAIMSADIYLPIHLLSYFGHYGVPVFVFLSGYGLALKYEGAGSAPIAGRDASAAVCRGGGSKAERPLPVWRFVRYHYLKLFKMMVVGFVLFAIFDTMLPGTWHYRLDHVAALFGMVANLFPVPNSVIWPGPFWFFGLMLQLYIVYRLVLYRRHRGVTVALMVLCVAVQVACPPVSAELNWLRYNFVGSMLVFGAGLLTGRGGVPVWLNSGSLRLWLPLALLSGALVLAFCYNYLLWYIAPLLVVVFAVSVVKSIPQRVLPPLVWLGGVSAAMFVTHPAMRKVFFGLSRQGDVYAAALIYAVSAVVVAWVARIIIDKMPNPKI